MQKLLVLAMLAGVLFEGCQYVQSKMYRYVLIDPYSQITVYGTDGCSVSKRIRADLEENDIRFSYKNPIKNEGHSRELSRIYTQHYDKRERVQLPVVVVNNDLIFYPSFDGLMKTYARKEFALFD